MQSIQLSVSGLYTAPSDYAGLPPGALNRARNVESRHKNILESRRGFEGLGNTAGMYYTKRATNFPVLGVDTVVRLSSNGDFEYRDVLALTGWTAFSGYSGGIIAPDSLAKNRFIRGGQNLYLTDQSGVLSLSSGTGSDVKRAGVPKGLDISASTTGSSGFFTNNVVTSTTGTVASGSAIISNILDTSGLEVGQYVTESTGKVPAGTTISSITAEQVAVVTAGTTTVGGTTVSFAANPSAVAGQLVSGTGIQTGTKVVSQSGAGPYVVTINAAAYQAGTNNITFSNPLTVTMSANATGSVSSTPISFYVGSQVGYRVLFGRVETDNLGNTTTRYGTPSAIAVATNILGTETNTTVTATLPKNSSDQITFVQLYRSEQTASATITPVDEMALVYERNLIAGDFTARSVTISDIAPDSVKGMPLYTGQDQEGVLQANNPPPACWDMTVYRDFALYANCTQPSTLDITLDSVGAPLGVQIGDTITIVSGSSTGIYTAAAAENKASKQFKVFSAGTPSQNITDTANSIIAVINYDESLPVHAILTSSTTDLPGKMTLESDVPYGTFTATMSAHTSSFDPALLNLTSEVNTYNNGVFVSKSGEIEAVPGANLQSVGDSSASIIRVIALRDYALVIKSDGLYKIIGTSPNNLSVQPFDLTTKIIGPDTAVQLNSGVWMLSNQGVVSIDDSGVNAKSPPIDNQINELLGSVLDGLNDVAFAVGYEADRKYILSVPATDDDTFTSTQHVFNYVTNSWTTWDRNLYQGFVHSNEGKLYIARADGANNGLSKERKSGTYRDYADEEVLANIDTVTSTTVVILDDVSNLAAGDILYQSNGVVSPIEAIDLLTNTVTTQYAADWVTGAVSILKAIDCEIQFKQVFGDNPAFVRQFPEGLLLFKQTGFNQATLSFSTDYSQGADEVDLEGTLLTGWGLFVWGDGTWGGTQAPSSIRFYVPADKQLGSYIIPTLSIAQAWSQWRFQGMSLSWIPVNQEVGK